MRLLSAAIFCGWTAIASSQTLVEARRVPVVSKYFDERPGKSLRCDVSPIPTQLNFGLRFQAGYVVRIPMNQYLGSAHRIGALMRVIPEGGTPVYLGSTVRLPTIPKTNRVLEFAGLYLVGEGRYKVDWML